MINERTYGGVSPEEVGSLGVPKPGKDPTGFPCPHCECKDTYHIQLEVSPRANDVASKLLRGHTPGSVVYTNYVGCPACPWASQAMMTSSPSKTRISKDDVAYKTTSDSEGSEYPLTDVEETIRGFETEVEAKLRTALVTELESLSSLCLDDEADRNTLIENLISSFMSRFSSKL
jgi:hypothetical protein